MHTDRSFRAFLGMSLERGTRLDPMFTRLSAYIDEAQMDGRLSQPRCLASTLHLWSRYCLPEEDRYGARRIALGDLVTDATLLATGITGSGVDS